MICHGVEIKQNFRLFEATIVKKKTNPARRIIHIDMDAFFASVEQRDFPEYRNKPVVVGGTPAGRGVVAAASYEARKYGIHSAMPASRAIKLCPHAIFIRPRFDTYREVSNQLRDIFFGITDLVEPLSLDEAYLDVTENKLNLPSGTLIAQQLRREIKEKTGLTASAGVAPNKFLAKIASDINKPDGLYVITPEEAEDFIEKLKIDKFYGVGKATATKMARLGIRNGADLKKWTELDLVKHFGKTGHHYFRIVRGVDDRKVSPNRVRKSIGKERTFSTDISDLNWIHDFLNELSTKVAGAMQKKSAAGKTITLKIRYDNFETITRSYTLPQYTNDPAILEEVSKKLLMDTDTGTRRVRLLGISVSSLDIFKSGMDGHQLELPFNNQGRHLPSNKTDVQ